MKLGLLLLVVLCAPACNPVFSGQPRPFLPHFPALNPDENKPGGLKQQLQDILVNYDMLAKNEVGMVIVSDGSLVLEEEAVFPLESLQSLFKLYVDVVREQAIGIEREKEEIDLRIFRALGVHRADPNRLRMSDLIPWAELLIRRELPLEHWKQFFASQTRGGWATHKTASGNLFLYAGKGAGILARALFSPDKKVAAFILVPDTQGDLSRELLRKIIDSTVSETIYFPI